MVHNLVWIVFNADTNNLDIRAPFFGMGVHHLLVVSHWSLARWAPGGPEINKPNLSLLMLQELILLGFGKVMLLSFWPKFSESWNSPILSELFWNHQSLLRNSLLMSSIVFSSLHPHVHVKPWEKCDIDNWNTNHNHILEIKTTVQSVWQFDGELFLALGLSSQMLPGLKTAQKFPCDSNRVEDNE